MKIKKIFKNLKKKIEKTFYSFYNRKSFIYITILNYNILCSNFLQN